jgi:hypothetical protein
MSLTEVAVATGLHREAIARAERKNTDVRASTLAAIARAPAFPSASSLRRLDMSEVDEHRRRGGSRPHRGIFERPKRSGVWWVRYHDEHGREHREKVGPKKLAEDVYRKRKTVDDVVALLGETINHVRRGALDPKVGTAVGYLAGLLLKALEQGDLAARLAVVEAAVQKRLRP